MLWAIYCHNEILWIKLLTAKWYNMCCADAYMPAYHLHLIPTLSIYASQFTVSHVLDQDKLSKPVFYSHY